MPIYIEGKAFPGLDVESMAHRLGQLIDSEDGPSDWDLSIRLVDDAEMAGLHNRWMGINGPTDVLSFGADNPDVPDIVEGSLGDVVVSIDTAERQAEEHGIPVSAEIMLLAAHGTLHLLLYDDMDEESSQIMRAKEKEYVPEAFREV